MLGGSFASIRTSQACQTVFNWRARAVQSVPQEFHFLVSYSLLSPFPSCSSPSFTWYILFCPDSLHHIAACSIPYCIEHTVSLCSPCSPSCRTSPKLYAVVHGYTENHRASGRDWPWWAKHSFLVYLSWTNSKVHMALSPLKICSRWDSMLSDLNGMITLGACGKQRMILLKHRFFPVSSWQIWNPSMFSYSQVLLQTSRNNE